MRARSVYSHAPIINITSQAFTYLSTVKARFVHKMTHLDNTGMSVKHTLVQCLEELKTINLTHPARSRPSKGKAEKVLNLIFQTGLKNTSFTSDEKKTIGALLANAIEPIRVNVESTANVDRTRLNNAVLMKRSAIQFLIDNYGSFPVGNSTLANELERANIAESVEILNNLIDKWCDASDSDEGSSDREAAGAKLVPPTHTWWTV